MGDVALALISWVVICADIWGEGMLGLFRKGRSDDVLPLLALNRLKPRVRGVNICGETGDPSLTEPVATMGGKPGVRGTITC